MRHRDLCAWFFITVRILIYLQSYKDNDERKLNLEVIWLETNYSRHRYIFRPWKRRPQLHQSLFHWKKYVLRSCGEDYGTAESHDTTRCCSVLLRFTRKLQLTVSSDDEKDPIVRQFMFQWRNRFYAAAEKKTEMQEVVITLRVHLVYPFPPVIFVWDIARAK